MAVVTPAEHMKDLLDGLGYTFGGSGNFAMYIGGLPASTPHRVIGLYDAGGKNPNPKWLLDYPSVQIRVRGGVNDYAIAYQEARKVRDLILGVSSYTAGNGDRIVMANAIGDVAFMGRDDSARPEFSFNFALIIEPAQTADNLNREPL